MNKLLNYWNCWWSFFLYWALEFWHSQVRNCKVQSPGMWMEPEWNVSNHGCCEGKLGVSDAKDGKSCPRGGWEQPGIIQRHGRVAAFHGQLQTQGSTSDGWTSPCAAGESPNKSRQGQVRPGPSPCTGTRPLWLQDSPGWGTRAMASGSQRSCRTPCPQELDSMTLVDLPSSGILCWV